MRDVTLCIPLKQNQICLGMKKRGFGADLFNGFGGKLMPGEDIETAAIRELSEEASIQVNKKDLKKVGELSFTFADKPEWDQKVHVYVFEKWEGEFQESDEMKPEWFSHKDIPFGKMWPDDSYWLPHVLDRKFVLAQFVFAADQKTIQKYEMKLLP